MRKYLQSAMSNAELLELYGYEPYDTSSIQDRWRALTTIWNVTCSEELGHMRQMMLLIHMDLCPDDERWREVTK